MRRIVQSPAGTSQSSEPSFFIFAVRSIMPALETVLERSNSFVLRTTGPRERPIFTESEESAAPGAGVG